MEDKRLTKRLVDYWNRMREANALPSWEKFNIAGLGDIWESCCVWRVDVISVENSVHQYTFEHVGNRAQEALGKDLTGMVFGSHFQKFPGARIAERIDEALEKASPIVDEGTFVNEKNQVVKYRSCLLPFGKSGKVTRMVLGLSWKVS